MQHITLYLDHSFLSGKRVWMQTLEVGVCYFLKKSCTFSFGTICSSKT